MSYTIDPDVVATMTAEVGVVLGGRHDIPEIRSVMPPDPPPIEPVIELLRRHGLIVTRKHAGRWWVRGHGVEGVLSHRGRWGGDPEPALYLDRLGNWNKMATAQCFPAPRSGRDVRLMLRTITQSAT